MRRPAAAPASGMSRKRATRRFSWATPLRNSIIEMTAELAPMVATGYIRAATLQ